MMGDRFNVVSLGIGINGAGHRQVISQLMLKFQLSKQQALALMNKKIIIKKSVDWNTAEEYLDKLTQAGMAADIDIAMSRELFLGSLEQRNITQRKSTVSPRHTLELDLKTIVPKWWVRPNSCEVKSSNNKTLFNISNINSSTSYTACLFATALVITAMLYFLSLLAGDTISAGVAATIGVLLVPVAIVFLPSIFSIRRMIHFTTGNDQARVGLVCSEKSHLNPLVRHYNFLNRKGNQIAYVSQSRLESRNLDCYSPDGKLMFKLRPYTSSQESIEQFFRTIKDCLLQGRFKELTTTLLNKKNPYDGSLDLHKAILNREVTPKLTINDSNNRPVALLYKEYNAYIEMAARQPDEYPLPCILMLALLGFNAGS